MLHIKQGIMELIDERLRTSRAKIAASQIVARAPSSHEFNACGAHEFFRAKDLITSRCWITDIENSQWMSFSLRGKGGIYILHAEERSMRLLGGG